MKKQKKIVQKPQPHEKITRMVHQFYVDALIFDAYFFTYFNWVGITTFTGITIGQSYI